MCVCVCVCDGRVSLCSAFDYDTENMNSEDIYSSLKGVTEAIQNFSVRSQEDMKEPARRREGDEVGGAARRDPGPAQASALAHAHARTHTRISLNR